MDDKVMNIIAHGFGGTTRDVANPADFLRAKGHNAHIFTLAGHGGTKEELAASGHKDWVASLKSETEKLLQSHEKVNIIGFSMGGLLAANVAAALGAQKVGKVVYVNTPIYFWNFKEIAKDIFSRDAARRRARIAYYFTGTSSRGPKSNLDFLTLLRQSKRLFSDVEIVRTMPPALILQTTRDETVRPKSAAYLKQRLSVGTNARLIYYEGGCHHIFTENPILCRRACRDICDFISRP